jgi:hypothetical protein
MPRPKKITASKKDKSKTDGVQISPVAENAPQAEDAPRRMKLGGYQSFKLQKSVKPARKPVASGFKLFKQALGTLKNSWKLFAGILAVYGILNVILVGGLSNNTDLPLLKDALNQVFTGNLGSFSTGLTLFTVLVGSLGSGGTTAVASAYQTILLLVISVILIWALRQVYASHKVGVRDAFYKGVYPLIPFILVLLVIGLQLVPLVLGTTLYSLLVGGGIAITVLERALTGLAFLALAVMSVYMICSSIFALYIVTLPDMTPMKALRSARELVQFRRWVVLRKILFLPIAILVVSAFIMIPISLYVTPAATAIFFVLTIIGVGVIHSYMYALYRELLS